MSQIPQPRWLLAKRSTSDRRADVCMSTPQALFWPSGRGLRKRAHPSALCVNLCRCMSTAREALCSTFPASCCPEDRRDTPKDGQRRDGQWTEKVEKVGDFQRENRRASRTPARHCESTEVMAIWTFPAPHLVPLTYRADISQQAI